jgi:uncharacterized membrane protein
VNSSVSQGRVQPSESVALPGAEGVEPRSAVREHAWSLGIGVAMTAWSLVLFGIARDAYLGFREGRFDLGNMVQTVWNTAHGNLLEITNGATGEQANRLGSHVDPFLALLTPIWIVWPSPLALAFAQIAIVSTGALPVFWLGRRHLGSDNAAGLLALAYLAYPWVATSAGAAIHPVSFAIPFYLFCVWFLDSDRLVPFGVFAVLAMSTGELMGLPIAMLGIWYAWSRGRRSAGAAIAIAGAAWTSIAVLLVVPHFAGESSAFYGFYDEVGGSPQGLIRMLFTDPGAIAGALLESHDLAYLIWLTVPLLGLFFLAPALAAVAVPQLLANTLSDFRSMSDPRYHSVAAVIPFLIAATVFGISRLDAGRRTIAAAAVLTCSALLALFVAPWPRAVGGAPLDARARVAPARIAALRAALDLVPADARVSTTNIPGAQLSSRRYVYSVPFVERADWVVLDLRDPWVVRTNSPILNRDPAAVNALVRRLERDPGWQKVLERERVFVFRRVD